MQLELKLIEALRKNIFIFKIICVISANVIVYSMVNWLYFFTDIFAVNFFL